MTYPVKQEIPKNELGMVDIKLYIYNLLKNYVPLIEKIGQDNIFFNSDEGYENLQNKKSTIFISFIGGSTSNLGIIDDLYQIDIYAFSMEESDNISNIIINLLNRRDFDGIKIRLSNHRTSGKASKKGTYRNSIDFDFVYKDSKY